MSNFKNKLSEFHLSNSNKIIEHSSTVDDFSEVFKFGAVMFSGGVESTYLLYKHSCISSTPVAISFVATSDLKDRLKLISHLISITTGKNIKNIFIEPSDNITLSSIPDYAVKTLGLYGCIGGGNLAPDHMRHLVGSPVRFSSDCMRIGNLYRPLHNTQKDKVLAMAIEDGIIDIIKRSRSCVSIVKERCGVCWFCRERTWAFDRNGISED